jgi:hypothetical protein
LEIRKTVDELYRRIHNVELECSRHRSEITLLRKRLYECLTLEKEDDE